ncbi:hypothetical protein EVAR_96245_1 [Eumeta japonica]|uniref:Uncharacterized protein n=1 Tax=Eumeta variegata TaxID=151549 RepID=A0A4C1WMW9_EUMVA|nr:hypothetical protein EVAR_96245_1 [Eumeta japonica]
MARNRAHTSQSATIALSAGRRVVDTTSIHECAVPRRCSHREPVLFEADLLHIVLEKSQSVMAIIKGYRTVSCKTACAFVAGSSPWNLEAKGLKKEPSAECHHSDKQLDIYDMPYLGSAGRNLDDRIGG